MLNKDVLKNAIEMGLKGLWLAQNERATSPIGETDSPETVISKAAADMSKILSDAIDEYVRGAEATITSNNLVVVASSFGTPAAISPVSPLKLY